MKIWFTADTHFGHANIRNYCGRPFDSLAQMNDTMVTNWNSVVQPNDHVYHLGDFGFGAPEYLHRIAQRLRGKIHLILGNHDKAVKREPLCSRFTFIKDTHMLTWHSPENQKVRFWLSHYAHRTWPQWNYGTYHLFGHSHGNMPPMGKSFDVGVDCWNFFPISIDFVHKKMIELSIESDDKYKGGKSYEEREQEDLDPPKITKGLPIPVKINKPTVVTPPLVVDEDDEVWKDKSSLEKWFDIICGKK